MAGSQAARAITSAAAQLVSVEPGAGGDAADDGRADRDVEHAGQTTGLVQPAGTQPSGLILSSVPPEDLVMLMYIGRLDPSTIDTS